MDNRKFNGGHSTKGGDDPYARLKVVSKNSEVNKSTTDKVRITAKDPDKRFKKNKSF